MTHYLRQAAVLLLLSLLMTACGRQFTAEEEAAIRTEARQVAQAAVSATPQAASATVVAPAPETTAEVVAETTPEVVAQSPDTVTEVAPATSVEAPAAIPTLQVIFIVVTATPSGDVTPIAVPLVEATPLPAETVVAEVPAEPAALALREVGAVTVQQGLVLASLGNPVFGERIFRELTADGFTCADCHLTDSAEMLIGPGLYQFADRVAEQGVSPEGYLYDGLINPALHAAFLSTEYQSSLTTAQQADVLAYMLSLRDASVDLVEVEAPALEPTPVPTVETVAVVEATPVPVEPTAVPTAVPAAPADSVAMLVRAADAANGQALFNQMNDSGFACSTCHNVASVEMLVGPGLLGVPDRAATRVEGQIAERYLYNSIMNPNDYVVEGFNAGLMPQTYSEIYTAREVYDLVAYLLTLR